MARILICQIVTNARNLISNEQRWAQNARAITRGRDRIDPHHPRAKRFCAMGALIRSAFDLTGDADFAEKLAKDACAQLYPSADDAVIELETINDRGGLSAVLKLFDVYLAANPNYDLTTSTWTT